MASATQEFFSEQFASLDEAARWPTSLPAKIGKRALDLMENAKSIADQASANPHLNEAGKAAARYDALLDSFVEIERAAATLDRVEQETETAFRSLSTPSVDKSDLHSEMRDQEARSLVRAMPQEQRDHLERLPPALAAAVIRAPAELSGVSPSVHAMVRTQMVEATHPDKVQTLRADKHAVELVRSALKDVKRKLDEAAQFSPADRAEYMTRVKSKAALPKANSLYSADKIDAVRSTYATLLKS